MSYLLTLNILILKNQIFSKNCDEWCVNATIIKVYYNINPKIKALIKKVKKEKNKKIKNI